MTDYSKYTDAELEQAKSAILTAIWCHECGNDFYYSSYEYKEDHAILRAIDDEIESRKSISELTTDLMKGFLGC